MATPTLTPSSQTSAVALPATGTYSVASTATNYPYGLYVDSSSDLYDVNFVTGAVEQVTFTYRKIGGDVLDIELTAGNIYAAYEEATLEYSYIVNVHQSKEVMSTTVRWDDNKYYTNDNSGNYIEETANYFVIILGGKGETGQAVISMKSSQLTPSRNWNSKMKNLKIKLNLMMT